MTNQTSETESTRWRALRTPEEVVDALVELFTQHGSQRYDEVVSQTAHAEQAAALATENEASPALVAAALLHDIGHLLEPAAVDGRPARDFRHEDLGARFLSNWFDTAVTGPIAHHVAAKRYLCAVDPDYLSLLSPASVHSLALQGGPMSPAEVAVFDQLPGAAGAVRLRLWDDMAKDADRRCPPLASYRQTLAALVSVDDEHRAE